MEEKKPNIAVVIPVKNEEKYIEKCLLALLVQEYPEQSFCVIVIDNGSTDGTKDIVESFRKSGKIKLYNKSEGTIGSLRNYGASFSDSKIVAFLDGDCIPDKTWLSVGVTMLESSREIGCVGFVEPEINKEDMWVENAWNCISSTSKPPGDIEVPWLSSFNLIMWRETFESVGGFNEELVTCEDADIGYKIGLTKKLILSDITNVRHLDNAKTLKCFFKKEVWRGKSNLKSFILSSNKKHDFLSVFVPAFYLLINFFFLIGSMFFLLFDEPFYFLTNTLLICGIIILSLPPAITFRKGHNFKSFRVYCQAVLLFYVYLMARGKAIFKIGD